MTTHRTVDLHGQGWAAPAYSKALKSFSVCDTQTQGRGGSGCEAGVTQPSTGFHRPSPLRVLHVVHVSWRLLVHVAAGPLLYLPEGVHHGGVAGGVRALEVLVGVGGRDYSAGLGGVRLHSHVRAVRGVALREAIRERERESRNGD